MTRNRERLVFFDVMRILCCALVVVFHAGEIRGWYPFTLQFAPLGIVWISIGQMAVYTFIFISGAVLTISHDPRKNPGDAFFDRLARIYPALWVMILFALILDPQKLQNFNAITTIPILTSFTMIYGDFTGPISGTFWFVGAIILLYALFPLLYVEMRERPLAAMTALILISVGSMFVLTSCGYDPLQGMTRWFPLCNAPVFAAGILCAHRGWYPSLRTSNEDLYVLAEMSFFAFLYHPLFFYIRDFWLHASVVVVVAYAAMRVDGLVAKKVREWLRLYGGRVGYGN